MSLGTRYSKAAVPSSPTKYDDRIPNIIQYILINKSAKSFLMRDDNLHKYLKLNLDKRSEGAHICQQGIYKGACCGQVFRNNDFFSEHPDAMQIHIGSDDF